MRDMLRKAKPQRLDDLIALNALYRPGPLQAAAWWTTTSRASRARPRSSTSCRSSSRSSSDTYGVIAYQEQVMRIARVLAGFTLGQADVLRKAMGKKDPKVMAKQREAFMEGAQANGVNEKKATKIFELMEYFAGYGFNKSHSTAYALLAYQTAYLKANYPVAFHGGAADDRGGRTPTSSRCISASAAIAASRCCRRTSTRASWRSRSSPKACASVSAR